MLTFNFHKLVQIFSACMVLAWCTLQWGLGTGYLAPCVSRRADTGLLALQSAPLAQALMNECNADNVQWRE